MLSVVLSRVRVGIVFMVVGVLAVRKGLVLVVVLVLEV